MRQMGIDRVESGLGFQPVLENSHSASLCHRVAIVAILVCCMTQEQRLLAQESKPHPWMASAPGEFVRLIDRGNVKITIDDERIAKAKKSALTLFQFSVKYDFKFRYEWIQGDPAETAWNARIIAWMDQPKVRLDHTICLQSTFQPREPWQSKLLKHEFDHVAISTDPRLVSIIQRVLQRRRNWVAKWEQDTQPSESDVRKRVQEEIDLEVKICEHMIQLQYDALDRESSDGLSDIRDRKPFFQELYSIQGLERCKFEYTDAIRSFVKEKLSSPTVESEVAKHYLFLSE
jgi:Cu/Ag efflux protein CusF